MFMMFSFALMICSGVSVFIMMWVLSFAPNVALACAMFTMAAAAVFLHLSYYVKPNTDVKARLRAVKNLINDCESWNRILQSELQYLNEKSFFNDNIAKFFNIKTVFDLYGVKKQRIRDFISQNNVMIEEYKSELQRILCMKTI